MRILWSSNAPWARTGYGNQTALMVPRIRALGHDVAIFGWYGAEGGLLRWGDIPVYPKAFHGYGADVLPAHYAHFQSDIAITLIDAWVMDPDAWARSGVRWAPWFPVDMTPIPPPVLDKVAKAFAPLTYSRFAEAACRRVGLDVRYVPHGYDPGIMRPGDRNEARQKLGLPSDRYIVSMVAANKGTPSRKALPESLAAFAELYRRHPEAYLYLHTHAGQEMGGINLRELIAYLGISDAVRFVDQYSLVLGLPDEYMAAVYNASDVLMAASMGEGFGIPILEAQACGCPVITGDWTSMSELTWRGVCIPAEESHPFWTPLGAYQYIPRIGALAAALEQVFRTGSPREVPPEAAEYQADNVAEKYWRPVLDEIAARLPQPVKT